MKLDHSIYCCKPQFMDKTEQYYARLFGAQTAEQAWKTAICCAIMAHNRGSVEMEREYSAMVTEDGTPILEDDAFLADLMKAFFEQDLTHEPPKVYPSEERIRLIKQIYKLERTKEFYRHVICISVNPDYGVFSLDDYIRMIRCNARDLLLDDFGPGLFSQEDNFLRTFSKLARIGPAKFGEGAERLADLIYNDITAEAKTIYNPWDYYCRAAFEDLSFDSTDNT